MEEALAPSEHCFRDIFDHALIWKAVAGLDGRPIQVITAFCRMLGYRSDELIP